MYLPLFGNNVLLHRCILVNAQNTSSLPEKHERKLEKNVKPANFVLSSLNFYNNIFLKLILRDPDYIFNHKQLQ